MPSQNYFSHTGGGITASAANRLYPEGYEYQLLVRISQLVMVCKTAVLLLVELSPGTRQSDIRSSPEMRAYVVKSR